MLFLKYISINAKKSMFDFMFMPRYHFVAQVYFCCPGMAADGRLVTFSVTVSDRPGGIAELARWSFKK